MKPVLLGLNNPHSTDPSKALGVEPANASGHRLWSMMWQAGFGREPALEILPEDYEEGFDRYNLLDQEVFRHVDFTIERYQFIMDRLEGRTVVMCGTNVPRALDLPHTGFHIQPRNTSLFTYYIIPHPSGLCREYNDPEMRSKVGKLLLALYLVGKF